MVDMAKTINGVGGKAEIIVFDGEGHGWRKAETMETTLLEELKFWKSVLGL